jgi:hypothetical protein
MSGGFQVGPFQTNYQQEGVVAVLDRGGGGGRRKRRPLSLKYYHRDKLEALYKEFEPVERVPLVLERAAEAVIEDLSAPGIPEAAKSELLTILIPFILNLPEVRNLYAKPNIDWARFMADNVAVPEILGLYDAQMDSEDREMQDLLVIM